MTWATNDPLFRELCESGYRWQYLPAVWFLAQGQHVEMPQLELRADISDAPRFADSVDIIVNGHTIEIKIRDIVFTSAADYPYPTAIVDTVKGLSEEHAAVVLVSQETGAMLAVNPRKRDGWTREWRTDRVRGFEEEFWFAPRSALRPMSALLKVVGR